MSWPGSPTPTGKVLAQAKPLKADENNRAIDGRNAFIMNDAAAGGDPLGHRRHGAGHAQAPRPVRQDRHHQRLDGRLVRRLPAHAGGGHLWIGYDTPAQAGQCPETGGGLSLPIWINFMEDRAQGRPGHRTRRARGRRQRLAASGITSEYARGKGVSSLGGAGLEDDGGAGARGAAPSDEPTARPVQAGRCRTRYRNEMKPRICVQKAQTADSWRYREDLHRPWTSRGFRFRYRVVGVLGYEQPAAAGMLRWRTAGQTGKEFALARLVSTHCALVIERKW
jgi:hypothetical protein